MVLSLRTGVLVAIAALLLTACGGGGGSGGAASVSSVLLPFGVSSTSPTPGATGVPLSATISVTAVEALNSATVTSATFFLTQIGGGGLVSGTITVNGSTATFTPDVDLAPNTTYEATITTGAKTTTGSGLISDFPWRFTTVTVPDAPMIGTATATGTATSPGKSSVRVSFSFAPPQSNGGATITGFAATSFPGGLTASSVGPIPPAFIEVPELIDGTPYTFTVTATNDVGTGLPSAPSNSVTPNLGAAVPGVPTFGAPAPASAAGNGQVTVNFNAPASSGTPATILGYTVTARIGGAPTGITASGGGTSIVVPGLTNGTAYTFTAVAFNSTGPGPSSAPSGPLTPAGAPGAPTGVSASATAPGGAVAPQPVGTATVTFSAPASNGGSAITGYTVTSSPGGPGIVDTNAGTTALSHLVTGLIVGTPYTFTVTATNGVPLTSPPSAPSASVIPTPGVFAPGTPPGVTAVRGNAQATVTITPPACALPTCPAISNFVVTALIGGAPTGITASGGGTSILVSGLANGTAYTFTATATNAVGTSPPSPQSNSVTPATVPDPPTAVGATAGNMQGTVSFTPPASNGGAAITIYTAFASSGGAIASGSASPLVVTGLTNGVAYTFTVRATNSVGIGAPSLPSGSATPVPAATVPGPPTAAAAVASDRRATVSFSAPASDGGATITSYTVTSSPGLFTGTGTGSPIVVGLTGNPNIPLNNGTAYSFTVTATNSVGTGPASAASNSVTPGTTPDAPTAVNAIAGNAQATVSVTPPANHGGAPILGYSLISIPGGITASGAASPIVVMGLTNTVTYTFEVRASNSFGASLPATSNPVTPSPGASAPGAPTITGISGVSVSPLPALVGDANGRATVNFNAPASDGGSTITGYTVTSSPGGPGIVDTNAGTTALSHLVTGLIVGTPYTFTVRATNAVGTGPASGASSTVTPQTVPNAPTAVSAVAGNNQATVSFTPPSSNGGAAITSHEVEINPVTPPAASTFVVLGATSPLVVTGLSNTTTYRFRVRAINSQGIGSFPAFSNTVAPSTAATVPGAPTAASAINVSAPSTALVGQALGHADVTFTAPADGGSVITGYTVTSSPGGITASLAGATAAPINITGLLVGTTYTFTVTATNAVGTSPASGATNSVTPVARPGAPTAVSAIAGNAQATVSFTPPASNGGAPIIDYTVTSSTGFTSSPESASPIVIFVPNNVLVTFTVTARNSAGVGPSSTPPSIGVTPTSATVPDPPTGANAALGGLAPAQATVTFSAPLNAGGSPVTGFTVTSIPPGGFDNDAGTTSLSHRISGLTIGTSYAFRVTASNAIGTSLASGSSNSVTPISAPGRPTGVVASPGNMQATVSFTPPVNNGGAPITSYTVTSSPGLFTGTGTASPIVVGAGGNPNNPLTNGTAYNFTVTATNSAGTGLPSTPASNSVTPTTTPPACSPTVPVMSGGGIISLRATASRSSGVAPLAVFFDASATTSSATTRPFHDIEYRWTFGDPAGGAMWTTGSRANLSSKNLATGPVASHVFDPALGSGAQSYTVILEAFDGTDTATCSLSISASDPTTAFPLGDTVCFSNDNVFTGCPAGASQVPFSNNFITVASAATAGNSVRRLLLKRGGTWNVASTAGIGTAGPGIVGAFGTGAAPVLNATINGHVIRLFNTSDWRIMDLNIVGNGGASQRGFRNTTAVSRITFLRLTMSNLGYGFLMDIGDLTSQENAFVESTITNSCEYALYTIGTRISVLGNNLQTVATQHVMRFPELVKGVLSNNSLGGGAPAKDIIKLNGPSGGPGASEQIMISDNLAEAGNSSFIFSIAPQTNNVLEIVRETIVERNLLRAGPNHSRAADLSGNEITVRNNICDVTLGAVGGSCFTMQQKGSAPAPIPNNIRIYNNTAFSNTSGFFEVVQFVGANAATNVTARNNLGSAPFVGAGARMIDGTPGAGFAQSTNLLNNSPVTLFGTAAPFAPADFQPAAGSPAIDTGTGLPLAPVFSDFFRTGRPRNATWDIGAVECSPATCP